MGIFECPLAFNCNRGNPRSEAMNLHDFLHGLGCQGLCCFLHCSGVHVTLEEGSGVMQSAMDNLTPFEEEAQSLVMSTMEELIVVFGMPVTADGVHPLW